VYEGATEVGGAIITAVSNTLVSFIPVFFLTDQEGKLFGPLAFTKTFAIGSSVVLAITVVPFLCYLLFRPVKWRKQITAALAIGIGVLATLATHAAFMWGLGKGHGEGWLISAAVGVGVALCGAGAQEDVPRRPAAPAGCRPERLAGRGQDAVPGRGRH
jgi:Cu(I)/Ag(I) efflux system membrane protein CusA/SilA